jgi:putative transposase
MQTYGSIIPGGPTLARLLPAQAKAAREPPALPREVKHRLLVLHWCEDHGGNVALAARHFCHSRSTLYDWRKRYRQQGLNGLADRSRRPHHVRQPLWTEQLVEKVRELRNKYPRWGKDKLVGFVREAGYDVSVSKVGRILTYLKRKGLLRNPDLRDPCIVRRAQIRPYATRKPKDYLIQAPGDLVQVDTADVRLDGSAMVYKHFAARDYVSRWDVLDVHHNATATNAADFLDVILQRMPFPVRAIQVDGGSEFKAEFEAACQTKGVRLFVLPPRSPKLNGRVERSNGTHKEEFYQMLDPPDSIAELRKGLRTQEVIYNTIRPHQALGQRTPKQFYDAWLLACAERG